MTMEQEVQTAMLAAEASYRRDATFRRYVDMAVNEAMRHVRHIEGEYEERDFHHVAVTAALAVLRLTIDGDAMLKHITAERDAYREAASKSFLGSVTRPL